MNMKYFIMVILIIGGCSGKHGSSSDVFSAVEKNNVSAVKQYLDKGGDPNAVDGSGRSLLYIATGPHGGKDVLQLLLGHKADPNKGKAKYTPLMNAASWVRLDGVKLLIKAGADPLRTNAKGKNALECVGNTKGGEKTVIEYLKQVIASHKK